MADELASLPAGEGVEAAHWALAIPEDRRRHLRVWLWSGACLTFLIIVVGGVTRLTQSGLSIVDWDPIVGVIPPLSDPDWSEAFRRYQQFPEYQKLRQGMTLGEFRFIYFWEYTHRLLARLVGVAFLIPLVFFSWRRYLTRPLFLRVSLLFGLGALQGFMGWFMVSSGLVDDPRVSHYRLAAHFAIALTILGSCVWLARALGPDRLRSLGARPLRGSSRAALWLLGGLLILQVLWGALVAGLDAGLIFNSFPRMGDGLIPPGAWQMRPRALNLLENPATVQWVHRLLGTLLLVASLAVFARHRARSSGIFAALVTVQYGLGVATLLQRVPVALGVAHQGTAVLIVACWLLWLQTSITAREREGIGLAGHING
ncbi:MAG TPA: COX15/CtaA family protein [Longimicrobiaceae bacterium]